MKSRFESKLANRAMQVVITLCALGFFLLLRQDYYQLAKTKIHNAYQQRIVTPRVISQYMESNQERKLQIGAGGNSPAGWLNSDIDPADGQAFVDATKPLPFPDGSFQYVFGEHFIEHITYTEGLSFFKEAHRILKPGGRIRMVTPDLHKYVSLFQEPDVIHSARTASYVSRKLQAQDWEKSVDPATVILNNQMRWFGHQFLYTPALLKASMEAAGFKNVRLYVAGESDDAVFKKADFGPGTEYRDVNAFESMALEGTR